MTTKYDSRLLEKFVVRLPDGLRSQVEDAAGTEHTSMNSVVVRAIEQYLDTQCRQKLLLDALAKRVGASVGLAWLGSESRVKHGDESDAEAAFIEGFQLGAPTFPKVQP